MPARRAAFFLALALAALGTVLSACQDRAPTAPPKLTLRPASFDQLAGWADDNVAGAVPAFLKSCRAFLTGTDDRPLDPAVSSGDFGTIGDWRGLCAAAEKLPGTDAAAKEFFAGGFVPMLTGNHGDSQGRFTGYFEIALNGSRRQQGAFQTPIYRRPADPNAVSRAEIDAGALAGKKLEIAWVDDPVCAYLLNVQGSGRIRLDTGGTIRVGYDGGNTHPYVAIGHLLVERGEIPLSQLTMDTLRAWITSHGDVGTALMRENPFFVFFKEIAGDGPLGTEQVVLTTQRSLAVDREFIPLGVPLWLDAKERFAAGSIRRLVIAQDTGGAIKGPVRGDLFWGSGDAAGTAAGAMNAAGRYYLLLPQAVAARAAAASAGD
jgi:membrane-bound lytic murein transglycosylase A